MVVEIKLSLVGIVAAYKSSFCDKWEFLHDLVKLNIFRDKQQFPRW